MPIKELDIDDPDSVEAALASVAEQLSISAQLLMALIYPQGVPDKDTVAQHLRMGLEKAIHGKLNPPHTIAAHVISASCTLSTILDQLRAHRASKPSNN